MTPERRDEIQWDSCPRTGVEERSLAERAGEVRRIFVPDKPGDLQYLDVAVAKQLGGNLDPHLLDKARIGQSHPGKVPLQCSHTCVSQCRGESHIRISTTQVSTHRKP
jgi:hypothetical protein